MITATALDQEDDYIIWKFTDGTSIVIDRGSSYEDKVKVMSFAIKTLKGHYPSINSFETIDRLLEITNED